MKTVSRTFYTAAKAGRKEGSSLVELVQHWKELKEEAWKLLPHMTGPLKTPIGRTGCCYDVKPFSSSVQGLGLFEASTVVGPLCLSIAPCPSSVMWQLQLADQEP